MKTTETKTAQQNSYRVYDSSGRATEIAICASNINDAFKIFKSLPEYNKYCFGKIRRCYNGGVRG